MTTRLLVPTLGLCLGLLTACGKPPETVEELRPVRVAAVSSAAGETEELFSGEVRARVESTLSFRVAGKIISRDVDVGTEVRAGQILARLDPGDLRLDAAGAKAQLEAARAQLALATSDLARQKVLLEDGHIAQALYDRYNSQYAVARAQVEALTQQARERGNQAAYATLSADRAGIVTAVEAEPGQVVQPGQPVFRLAQAGEREVAITVPEARIGLFQPGGKAMVASWAEPGRRLEAVIREVAGAADPATRTYRVRVAVPDAPPALRLGMTATVTLAHAAEAGLAVPLPAVTDRGDGPAVWVLDGAAGTVARRPVTLGGLTRDGVLVTAGLTPGELVVTAGANLLTPGQRVAATLPPAPPPQEGKGLVQETTRIARGTP